MDAKVDGDLVYVIGETAEELGGSEYFIHLGCTGNTVPGLDAAATAGRYRRMTEAIRHELVASAYPVTHGGLGIALAKVAIAGRLGMDITIPAGMRPDYLLFSESLGRFVVTISPDNKRAFERVLGNDARLLGRVRGTSLRITQETTVLDLPVSELEAAYKAPFLRY
jgi:phosphoribosylformylglycinamidine synthase